MKWVSDFLNLIYPNTCKACDSVLEGNEATLCTACHIGLPYMLDTAEIERKFWGKIPVKAVIVLLKFAKEGRVQRLLHRLKYSNEPEVGQYLGTMLGQKLMQKKIELDVLISVPMHPEKQKQRGYNQAEEIAIGVGEITQIKLGTGILIKSKNTISQTKKSREERSKNVENLFEIMRPTEVLGQRIGLVDDVLTTGATLEACGNILLEAGAKEIVILTVASAG